MKMIIQKTLLTSAALCATAALSHGSTLSINSNKESHIRQSGPNDNQGQNRLIMGAQLITNAQGTVTSTVEFRVMMQFKLTNLVSTTGGGAITIDSVNLDLGDAFAWSGLTTTSTFELRAWNVTDFNVANNTWNDPQGSAGADGAGGTLGTVLSTETFDNTIAEGDFIFGSEANFVSSIQSAYDNDTLSGATINVLAIMKNDGSYENAIPRTDSGAIRRIGTADLNISYTAVPEPSSTALLGLGGLALILRRRK